MKDKITQKMGNEMFRCKFGCTATRACAVSLSMVRALKLPPQMPRYQEVKKDVTKTEAKKILADKAKLSKETITYLDSYRYAMI